MADPLTEISGFWYDNGVVEKRSFWSRRVVRVIAAGAFGGIFAGLAIWLLPEREKPAVEPVANAPECAAAMQYAYAFQQGDWDYVVDHTLWMQERLRYELSRAEGPDHIRDVRLELSQLVSDRATAGNRLLARGVEDQYVFRPEAVLELAGWDEGRDDLEQPVAIRTWIHVTFPSESKALLDESGFPIRSLIVGINLTGDGFVLKAGVEGNLEIDSDSIVYWAKAPRKG